MTANPTEVMTEHELAAVDRLMMSPEKTNVSSYTRKLLSSAFQKLRSSRDEYQTALELKHKWMVEADATIERLENTARLMMEGRDKARADLSAARAEVSRLSGELASRPAKELVEAATMARDYIADTVNIEESQWKLEPHKTFRAKIVHDLNSALSQASSADALSAPAKEGVVLFTDDNGTPDGWAYAVSENSIECWAFQYPRKWINDGSIKGPLGEYIKKYPKNRRLSDSEAAAFLAEHPLPKDAFSPAPVAAPASAVSPASEEKDAKCIGCCGRGCVACNGTGRADGRNPASVSPTPAPAPSEDDNERPVKRLADILIKNLTEFRDELRQQNKTK